jgi:hypothetical protein
MHGESATEDGCADATAPLKFLSFLRLCKVQALPIGNIFQHLRTAYLLRFRVVIFHCSFTAFLRFF